MVVPNGMVVQVDGSRQPRALYLNLMTCSTVVDHLLILVAAVALMECLMVLGMFSTGIHMTLENAMTSLVTEIIITTSIAGSSNTAVNILTRTVCGIVIQVAEMLFLVVFQLLTCGCKFAGILQRKGEIGKQMHES